jgi:hypothetical protein
MNAPIRSMPELVDAIRARRDELNISHETIDNIAGLQSGYTSKLLGPIQLKGFSHMSLGAVLGALGIGLVVIEDPEAKAKVEGRWQKRKRPQRLAQKIEPSASTFSIQNEVPSEMQITAELQAKLRTKDNMKAWGQMGGKKGSKRRMKTMSARARQRVAAHAARIRWARAKA